VGTFCKLVKARGRVVTCKVMVEVGNVSIEQWNIRVHSWVLCRSLKT
jgi:hypothetical protein